MVPSQGGRDAPRLEAPPAIWAGADAAMAYNGHYRPYFVSAHHVIFKIVHARRALRPAAGRQAGRIPPKQDGIGLAATHLAAIIRPIMPITHPFPACLMLAIFGLLPDGGAVA